MQFPTEESKHQFSDLLAESILMDVKPHCQKPIMFLHSEGYEEGDMSISYQKTQLGEVLKKKLINTILLNIDLWSGEKQEK